MAREMRRGDSVRCVDAGGSPLKQGETYTVRKHYPAPHRLWDDGVSCGPIPEVQNVAGVTLMEDNGRYFASRFELIDETQEA